MKTLAKFVAPPLAAVLGYAAAVVFRPVENGPRDESVPRPDAALVPSIRHGEPDMDAVAKVIATLRGEPTLADLASVMAAIARLSPKQMAALLERVLTMPPQSSDQSNDRSDPVRLLMAAWVAHDPEAATEWMRPRIEQFARIDPKLSDSGPGARL